MVDVAIWLDIMEDKKQIRGTDQRSKESNKERLAAEIWNEHKHSANFSKKESKKKRTEALGTSLAICCLLLLGVTESCNISHISWIIRLHRCCLSPLLIFVYIACELAFDAHPPSPASSLPPTPHPSFTLSLISSSSLPPVTVTRRAWIFSEQGGISSCCEAEHWPGAPWKVPPPYPLCTPYTTYAPHLTPHYPSIWALSLVATLRTLRAGMGDLCARSEWARLQVCPSVWGRKSRRALAGAAVPGAACPPLKTVGTRFNWQNSTGQSMALLPKKDRANFHSPPTHTHTLLDGLSLEWGSVSGCMLGSGECEGVRNKRRRGYGTVSMLA